MAYDIGGRGDQSFNDSAAEGIDRAADEIGIIFTAAEPNADGSNRAELLQLQADGSDLVIGVGTRFQDFTTGSWTAFAKNARFIGINAARHDAIKHMSQPVVGDALRGIEADPNTPPQVKRLCRIARFGTMQPKAPDYASAFQEIGPAAIKLGQTLATRPDLVGEDAVRNLLKFFHFVRDIRHAHPLLL